MEISLWIFENFIRKTTKMRQRYFKIKATYPPTPQVPDAINKIVANERYLLVSLVIFPVGLFY